jgi:hypothetical protein
MITSQYKPVRYRGFHGKGIFAVRVYYFARREEHKKWENGLVWTLLKFESVHYEGR